MLSNAYFLAKFRFDTDENEPAKHLQILQNYRLKCFVPLRRGNMSKSGQSALDRLKEITNHATGRKRKDDADENHKDAKGGPGQGTFGGEGFTEAQLNQLARLIDCSVTSAVEKSVGALMEDMVAMSSTCAGAIEEQNSAKAAIKSEVEDLKTKTSEENLTKEIKRIGLKILILTLKRKLLFLNTV